MALALASPSPPKSVATSIQFSNVARFMGPSLRDQRHANFKGAGLKIPKLEKEKRRASSQVASSHHSAPSSPSASGPLGASDSFASEGGLDEESNRKELRRELALLEEEHRRHLANARVLETGIAETKRMERKAHRQAEQQRGVVEHHRRKDNKVGGQLSELRGQLEEQTQSAQRLYEAQGGGGSSGSRSCPQLPSVQELPGLTALKQPRARPEQPRSKADSPALRGSSSAPAFNRSAEGSVESPACSAGEENTLLDFFDQRDVEHKRKSTTKSIKFISPASSFSGLRLRDGAVHTKAESPEQEGSILDNHMKATWNTGCLDILDEESDDDMRRAAIRALMARHGGGRKPAFYRLDINQNGVVSYSEWENNFPLLLGISMPDERWASDKLKVKIKNVFRLFDHNGKGQLDLDKIFPGASREDDIDPQRMTTPEFWDHFASKTRGVKSNSKDRISSWKPKDAYEELDIIMEAREAQTDATLQGKKMRQKWKRLKSNGKSDARVREIVALHLPRGTGPEDRDGVPVIVGADVQKVRNEYLMEINDRTRSIQKGLFDMREQRKNLMKSRHDFAATLQPQMRKQAAANASKAEALKRFNEQMAAAEKIKEIAGNFAGALGAVRDKMHTAPPEMVEDKGPSFQDLYEKFGVDEDALEDLYKVWMKFADSTDCIGRRPFIKFLAALCPGRHLVNCDLEAWWDQLLRIITFGKPGFESPPQSPKNKQEAEWEENSAETPRTLQKRLGREKEIRQVKCSFAHFVAWYHSCELRITTDAELRALA